MSRFRFGVKIYASDWLTDYHLSPQDAAALLKEWGVDFVLAQSQYLPMPDSAVKSEASDDGVFHYTRAVDQELRGALRAQGIAYWATACTFFNPAAIEADENLRPVGSDGKPMQQIDWYIGIPPSMERYVAEQVSQIADAVETLQPDGVFLSFTRFPGFWELWLPSRRRQDFPEYSFDVHTLQRFARETGAALPTFEPDEAAKWIRENAANRWAYWKEDIVLNVIADIRDASRNRKPEVKIILNTIPFRRQDFDNARSEVFGQNIEKLRDVVDTFEVMTYHQILKRPVSWIPLAGEEVKRDSGRETVCTIQARPLYLDGMHADAGRKVTLDDAEFARAVNAVEAAGLDGVVVFTWSDLLDAFFHHGNLSRVDAVRNAAKRRERRDG